MSSFLDLLVGGGEIGERVRTFDWASTPLGPPDHWPQSLKTIVRTCLESPFPINLWCGSELVLIYNDSLSRPAHPTR